MSPTTGIRLFADTASGFRAGTIREVYVRNYRCPAVKQDRTSVPTNRKRQKGNLVCQLLSWRNQPRLSTKNRTRP